MGEDDNVTVSRPRLLLAGALTAAAGVAVSEAAANLLAARVNPIQAVAEVVIAKTPGSVAERLIHIVGRNDKPFLVAGITIAIIVLGAVAGLLAGRRPVFGQALFLLMAVVAFLAAASRPQFGAAESLSVILGLAAWLVVLSILLSSARQVSTSDVGRRRFLVTAGGVAVAAVAIGVFGEVSGRARRAVNEARARLRLPIRAGAVPDGAQLPLGGVQSWRVPNPDFYRIDISVVPPAVDPATWRLRIHGMVDKEIELSYDDLVARQLTQDWVTICCVSNPVGGPLIGNAYWSGVRVAPLLAEAGVQAGADAVKQTSHDGWTCGTPLAALTDSRNAMLAIGMNGEPLPINHGFPVRMIVPGLYGYVSACKWVVDLEVTTYDTFSAYWTDRGWSVKGPVKTESRIEVPGNFATVNAGTVGVGGHAWAQHTGIAKVEYRLDGNAWQQAHLGRVPSDDTWVQWGGSLQVASGRHTLAVRATDKSGYTQTPVQRDVVPNGATGWHTVQFTAS